MLTRFRWPTRGSQGHHHARQPAYSRGALCTATRATVGGASDDHDLANPEHRWYCLHGITWMTSVQVVQLVEIGTTARPRNHLRMQQGRYRIVQARRRVGVVQKPCHFFFGLLDSTHTQTCKCHAVRRGWLQHRQLRARQHRARQLVLRLGQPLHVHPGPPLARPTRGCAPPTNESRIVLLRASGPRDENAPFAANRETLPTPNG